MAKSHNKSASEFKEAIPRWRNSPPYWIEGVIIAIAEYLQSLQLEPFKSDATKAKIKAVKKCLKMAEREMRLCENLTKNKTKTT